MSAGIRGQASAGDVDQIGDHGGGRGLATRAGATVHRVAGGVRVQAHRVEHAIDPRQRAVGAQQGGMDAQLDPGIDEPGDAQMFDAIAQLAGELDIRRCHPGNAFAVNRREGQRHFKGHGRQDGELVRRVHPFYVKAGIGFGVAQGLSFGKHVCEGARLRLHGGQNKIAGAVDNAADRAHPVARHTLAQGLQNRDAAGHRRLAAQTHALLFGDLHQFVALLGNQGLVRGDHGLAVTHGGFKQFARQFGAADTLHQHIDIGAARDLEQVPIDRQIAGRAVGALAPSA